MKRRFLILAHFALASTFAAPAQVVSALSTPYSRDEVNALASEQLATMQATVTTKVQRLNTTTDATGSWAVTFSPAFVSAAPIVEPHPIQAASDLPVVCRVLTRSSTGATGDCVKSNSTTLPGTLTALGGLVVNPWGAKAPGVAVMVIGGEPTQ